MSDKEFDTTELANWDPKSAETAKRLIAPFVKLWFRAEVRGLETFPAAGGASQLRGHPSMQQTPCSRQQRRIVGSPVSTIPVDDVSAVGR